MKGALIMKKITSIFLTTLFLVGFILPSTSRAENTIPPNQSCNQSVINLENSERKLWQDHVLWTRNFIISDLAGLEDKSAVLDRLFQNQDEIGASIMPYYGAENDKKLSDLLRQHIALAGQVVDAAKNNQKSDLEKANQLWYENADSIAAFLSGLNPKWSKSALKDILYKHLQLTTEEATSRINKNWKQDISSYDQGEVHMLNLADVISQGIIAQFPDKFK